MIEVRQTDDFRAWLHRLKDDNAVARIVARIRRIEQEIWETPKASAPD